MLEFKPVLQGRSFPWLWLIGAILMLTVVLPVGLLGRSLWGVSSLQYELTPAELVIHYSPATVRVGRAEIRDAAVLSGLTGGRRIVGTAMPGFYQGSWSFDQTGRITLYATTRDRLVVLKTSDRTWGITPADPLAFWQALAGGRTGTWAPVRDASPWRFAAWFLLEIPLVLLVFLALAYYLPRPDSIRYLLQDDALVIRGGRMRVTIPYTSITDVRADSPSGWPLRKVGTGLPGLHWGSFAWKAAGPNLRLYTTRVKPLVLISTAERTYGISPAEEEQFMEALRQRISS